MGRRWIPQANDIGALGVTWRPGADFVVDLKRDERLVQPEDWTRACPWSVLWLFAHCELDTLDALRRLNSAAAEVGSLEPLPRDSSGSWARLGGDPFWRSRLGLRWDLHLSGLWHARSSKGPVTGRRDQAGRLAWRRAPGRFRRRMLALGTGVGVS